MTKTEIVAKATEDASKTFAGLKLSLQDVRNYNYEGKRAFAAELVGRQDCTAFGKNAGIYADVYRDRIVHLMYAVEKKHDDAVKHFKSLCASMKVDEAVAKATDIIKGFNLRGAVRLGDSYVEVERAGVSAAVYFQFAADYDDVKTNPEDSNERVYAHKLKVTISTSGSTWTPAQMVVVNGLNRDLTELAAELEATFARERVVRLYGFDAAMWPEVE